MGIWYRTGTASVSNGAAVVTGSLTTWLVYVRPGDRITFDAGGKWYEVLTVDSNTQITLATNFAETTVSGGAYAIDPSSYRHQIESDVLEQLRQLLVGLEDVKSATGFKFTFSSTVTMADPGTGTLRLNNAAMASVTAIAIDDLSADLGNPDISAFVLSWDDSSSTAHRGFLMLRKAGAAGNYAVYDITGASTDNAGWTQLAVTYVGGAGSFSNGDELIASFSRTGDNTLGYTPVNNAGDTITGTLKLGNGTAGSQHWIDGAAGFNRGISFKTGGLTRWFLTCDGSAESGANAGSNFALWRYDDAGAFVAQAVAINRATGFIGFETTPKVGGNNIAHVGAANTWAAQQTLSAALALNSGQINFPAAQNASAGANVLDDYEEGTFTPVLAGTTAAGAGTYTVQAGNYTKIGRLVTVQLTLTWTAHTGTGNMKITGLPFAAAALNVAAVRFSSVTFTGQFMAYVSNSTTEISILSAATGAGEAGIAMDTAATISMTLTYHV